MAEAKPKEQTIPLAFTPTQRATGTGDARMVNCIVETIPNPITRRLEVWVRKRPGLANHSQPPGASATGRGVFAWKGTNKIYSIFSDKIYSNTTDLAVTLAASSGRVWSTDIPDTAAAQLLILSDGTDNYNITTGDVATQIDENDDANYLTPNLGPVYYYYGHLVQGTTKYVVNTELNSTTSWLAADIKPLDYKGDAQEMFYMQKDRLISLGPNSFEMFYYRGNPIGSPLLRVEGNLLQTGIASRNTWANVGDTCFYVGENSGNGDGGRSVWVVQAGEQAEVSTPVINRFLAAEGSSISSASAWIEKIGGHLCYALNLASANRTFVYDLETKNWMEFEAAAGSAKWPIVSVTSLNGTIYGQDAANGRVYTISDTTFQDSGSAFTMTVQTQLLNNGTAARKFVHWVDLIADTQASGTATLASSDDNGSTWTTRGTFDMTSARKRIASCGSYRGERQYRLTHSANTAFRGQALVEAYSEGSH